MFCSDSPLKKGLMAQLWSVWSADSPCSLLIQICVSSGAECWSFRGGPSQWLSRPEVCGLTVPTWHGTAHMLQSFPLGWRTLCQSYVVAWRLPFPHPASSVLLSEVLFPSKPFHSWVCLGICFPEDPGAADGVLLAPGNPSSVKEVTVSEMVWTGTSTT